MLRQLTAMLAVGVLAAGRGTAQTEWFQDFETWPKQATWTTSSVDGWTLSDGMVLENRGGYAPPLGTRCGWLQDASVSTNSWLESPPLPAGLASISFHLRRPFNSSVTNTVAVEYALPGGAWTTLVTVVDASDDWAAYDVEANLLSPGRVRLRKTADTAAASYLGVDNVRVIEPLAVLFEALTPLPAVPAITDAVAIAVNAHPGPLVQTLSLSAFWRFGESGPFHALPMMQVTGTLYHTTGTIPPGYAGVIQYYVQAVHDGQAPSPVAAPGGGPLAPAAFATSPVSDTGGDRQRSPSRRSTALIVSEIHYHPAVDAAVQDLEFVELFNTDEVSIDLAGFQLGGDIAYTFPAGTVIPPRAYRVIARTPAAFLGHYGVGEVLGPYTNSLPNSGGTVRLLNKQGAELLAVAYGTDDPWPVAADGAGHSLVLLRPDHGEDSVLAWGVSGLVGGSPGARDGVMVDPLSAVVINEFLAHTDLPDVDCIELHNRGDTAADLAGCTLSDNRLSAKFTIPPGVVLAPGGYHVFTEAQLGFGLSATGEALYLRDTAGQRVLDAVRFKAQQNGVATGRSPDGAPAFHELNSPTPGGPNAGMWIRNVVINEIMFHPISGNDDDQFVELHNAGAAPVDVSHWQLDGGVRCSLPPGTSIPADGYLVIARSATNLIARYPQLHAGNTRGDLSGRLSHRGEPILLLKPDDPALPFQDFVVVDAVAYEDGWGAWSDGGGSSLELIDPRSDNRLAMNWADSDESTKASWTLVEHTGALDHGDSNYGPAELHLMLLDGGECLVDNVEVRRNGGANLLPNGDFESGLNGWIALGTHAASRLATQDAFAGAQSLHVVAESGGNDGFNLLEADVAGLNAGDNNVTLRARVRWLRGHRQVLLRLLGNWLECSATLAVPETLGTPGLVNSRRQPNAGPALHDLCHAPVLPSAQSNVVVTVRAHDPDGLTALTLRYRLDPALTLANVPMNDAGIDGDARAGDGTYAARIPGQAAGALIAFHVTAVDALGATNRLPRGAPGREALVLFGQAAPAGRYATYRFWITAATRSAWQATPRLSNAMLDTTLVYDNWRAVYDAGVRYRGSPWVRQAGDPLSFSSAYVFRVPKRDRLLGATSFNLDGLEFGRDDTWQRERFSFWMGGEVGIPTCHQRFVHVYINGAKRGFIYADVHHPNREYLGTWFPGDDQGALFEVDDWFEFNDAGGYSSSDARLADYTTTGGAKKQARYRWNWELKPNAPADDGYDSLFGLVNVVNLPLGDLYAARVAAEVDVAQWMRYFALRHFIGDWDGYGYRRGKNAYLYRPPQGRWTFLPWDMDFGLGANSDGPTQSLFDIGDPILGGKLFIYPAFRRLYWRAFQELLDGPLTPATRDAALDAQHAAFLANGIAATAPAAVKIWINSRVTYVAAQLAPFAGVTFQLTTTNGVVGASPIQVFGTAPLALDALRVNGLPTALTWSSETAWSAWVSLQPGTNVLQFEGLDRFGQSLGVLPLTLTYNGPPPPDPQGWVVINEVMYQSPHAGGDYVELYNRSPTETFDLAGLRLAGVDYVFPPATLIGPGAFRLVAANAAVYAGVYGGAESLAGTYPGSLSDGGEAVRLLRPDGTNWVVLDSVTYAPAPPWSTDAAGGGASLQRLDAARDGERPGNWLAVANGPAEPYTPGRTNATVLALPAFPALWINEVMPRNTATLADNTGEFDPWLELYNAEAEAIELTVFRLSDAYGDPGRWAFPTGTVIEAGQRLLVWADAQPPQTEPGHLHANFLLAPVVGVVVLSRQVGGHLVLIDSLAYDGIGVDQSYGAFPEGGSGRQVFHAPTPGSVNSPTSMPVVVRINEWMARNTAGLRDPTDGAFEDWFELYNPGDLAVDLGGYTLTDNPASPGKFTVPAGTVMQPRGFRLIWADDETGVNGPGVDLHVNFSLSQNGESLTLVAPDGQWVDHVDFGPQVANVSDGRWPDGGAVLRMLAPATPGAPNRVLIVNALPPAGGGAFLLRWNAQSGMVYRVEARETLLSGSWLPMGVVTAGGDSAELMETNTAVHPARFYRLSVDP